MRLRRAYDLSGGLGRFLSHFVVCGQRGRPSRCHSVVLVARLPPEQSRFNRGGLTDSVVNVIKVLLIFAERNGRRFLTTRCRITFLKRLFSLYWNSSTLGHTLLHFLRHRVILVILRESSRVNGRRSLLQTLHLGCLVHELVSLCLLWLRLVLNHPRILGLRICLVKRLLALMLVVHIDHRVRKLGFFLDCAREGPLSRLSPAAR